MKIFFLFIWTLVSFINTITDAQYFDPFLFEVDLNSPRFLELPSTNIPSWNDPNVIAACPAEIREKKILKRIYSEKAEYCLFQKIFDGGERVTCAQEIKPMLQRKYDDLNNRRIKCGPSIHFMFEVGFVYCGTQDVIQRLSDRNKRKTLEKYFRPRFFPIYEVCVNRENNKASWVKYSVMTPAIFQDENNEQKLLEETDRAPAKISTDDFLSYIREKYFTRLKKSFENQDSNKATMEATFMVPMEHIALTTWKNAVNHFINIAPFSSLRMKLITGINDGIKKIAFKLHWNYQRLSIYTAVRKFSIKGTGSVWDGNVQNPNVWYKLLYEEKTNLAAMLVMHNDESKETLEKKACQAPVNCETMGNWYEKRGENDVDKISQNDLAFAYCCIPNTYEVGTIFNIYLEINGYLNLDKWFNKDVNYLPSAPPLPPDLAAQVYSVQLN